MNISVVIPLYNKQDTIERAVRSVLHQTFLPIEIIVVNDGSSDKSAEVVESLQIPMLKLINQINSGVSAARNRGVKEAESEWVAFLDADDEWLPDFLLSILGINKKYPQCSILATGYFICNNGKDKTIKLKNVKKFRVQILEYFKVASSSSPPICSSAVVVKKSIIHEIFGFPEGTVAGEDLLTWAKLAKKGIIGYNTCCYSRYYIEFEVSKQKERCKSIIKNNEAVTIDFKNLLDLSKHYERYYLAEWYKIIAKQYLNLQIKDKAFSAINASIRLRPFQIKIYMYYILLLMPKIFINKLKYIGL